VNGGTYRVVNLQASNDASYPTLAMRLNADFVTLLSPSPGTTVKRRASGDLVDEVHMLPKPVHGSDPLNEPLEWRNAAEVHRAYAYLELLPQAVRLKVNRPGS
jgi:hypothetical protein